MQPVAEYNGPSARIRLPLKYPLTLSMAFVVALSYCADMNPHSKREEEQAPAHSETQSAHSLEEASNSDNSLQGYAAMNDVDRHGEIAKEAARETGDDREEIARLAYQYHQERGGHHGSHEEDWYRAEQVVQERRSKGLGKKPVKGI